MVLIIFILGIGNNTMAQTISTKDMEKILIDAVKKYTSLKYDESLELKIQEIKNSNKTDNEKYKELKKIYDNTKNGMNERQNYYGLLEKDMYVAYQFKKDLEEHPGKRISLGLSALVFNDEAMNYMLGVDPEKEKYKQMLKDFMKENKNYFECITYSNEIQSILSDSIAIAEDIASKEKLTKLYTSLENATSRSQIDEIIFKTTNDPIFKLEDGKYTFKSNLPKALDKAGDVLSIASTSLNGIQEICYAVSNIETYKLYEQFLRNICDYKKDGKYMMPYTMRGAAYELLYEMQGQFQAVLGNVLPLLQEYTKFGIDKVVDATKLTATGLLSSITTGISIGKFIGNVTLGMDEIVKSAAYVEGYAYLGELYSDILEKNKNTFVNNPTLKNAEQFKTNYDMLWLLRKKGEETYLSMVSFSGVWSKKDRDNLKSLTGYQEKETFCNNNIKMINSFQFIIKENIEPSIKITTKKSSMSVGDTFTFKATKKGISENIIWSVSNKKLATINSKTGKLTAKKAGTVTVIAKAGKSKTSVKLKIINKNVLEKGAKESYEVILDQYRQAIKNNFYKNILNGQSDNWDIIGDDVNIEMLSNARYSNKFKIYYAIEDIDNNGIPELVIGAYHGTDKPCYYDIFTYHGNKSIRLFPDMEFGYRTNFWINSNGIFQVSWSAGAMSYGYEHYHISSNGYTMKLVESISSRVVDYKDYSVKYYYKKENEKEITEKEYNQIEQDYNNNKNYTLSWIELSNNKK